ncbi:MAG TPA: efflux RND transporter periplasmic adaptor subunit [Bacteroidales bacterium]|nr:efflux RND transporter periplasmic adaptor subunit [Bacteroidales bacterium]
MKTTKKLVVPAILGLFLLAACQPNPGQIIEEQDSRLTLSTKVFAEAGMDSVRLADTVFYSILRCSGQVDVFPGGRQLISSPIGGLVNGFNALEGDRVGKGSLLFSITNPELTDLQYNMLEAIAELGLLGEQVQRARNLAEGDATSRRELQAAEAAYATAKARHEALQKKMESLQLDPARQGIVSKLNFHAPFAGIVAKRLAVNGQFVPADQPVLELIDDTRKNIHIEVLGTQRNALEENQEVLVLQQDGTPTGIKGTVLRISPLADPATSAVSVTAAFTSGDLSRLPVGSFVQIGIITHAKPVSYLPATAVIPRDGKKYVLVIEEVTENELILLPVEVVIGETNGALIELVAPSSIANRAVIAKGGFQLLQ